MVTRWYVGPWQPAPAGLREAFITGGLSPIGRPVDDIYGATYVRLLKKESGLLLALPRRPIEGARDLRARLVQRGTQTPIGNWIAGYDGNKVELFVLTTGAASDYAEEYRVTVTAELATWLAEGAVGTIVVDRRGARLRLRRYRYLVSSVPTMSSWMVQTKR
jgi:hypothetical protein